MTAPAPHAVSNAVNSRLSDLGASVQAPSRVSVESPADQQQEPAFGTLVSVPGGIGGNAGSLSRLALSIIQSITFVIGADATKAPPRAGFPPSEPLHRAIAASRLVVPGIAR